MDLKLISYNTTGFNGVKSNFINFLCKSMGVDVFLVQEHLRLRQNIYKLQQEFKEFDSFILPANKTSDRVCAGRPSGGIGIFWNSKLNKHVNIVKHPNSTRVQGIEVGNNNLIINTSFPVDPRVNEFNDFELLKCIEDIKWYIETYPEHYIIIAGDLNCDFSRNTRFVNIVREFLMNFNLVTVWSQYYADFTFSNNQVRNGVNILSTSCIDHFITYQHGLNSVNHAQVIHLGDNLSNHNPIFMSFNANFIINNNVSVTSPKSHKAPNPIWHKASPQNVDNYRNHLKAELDNYIIDGGLVCNDPNCDNKDHLTDIDHYCKFILESIDSGVKNFIPVTGTCVNNSVEAGWSDLAKPYQEDARFWHAIWTSLGKPINCEIHNVMKHTRNQFHYAVRRLKKNASLIKETKLHESFINGKVPNLIKELK